MTGRRAHWPARPRGEARIVAEGVLASRFFGQPRKASVAAVLSTSCYVQVEISRAGTDPEGSPDDAPGVVCLLADGLGMGPLIAAIRDDAPWSFAAWGIRAGDTVQLGPDGVCLGSAPMIAREAPQLVRPPPWPPVPGHSALRHSLSRLEALAVPCLPDEGLARLVLTDETRSGLSGALDRRARPAIDGLARWLGQELNGQPSDPTELAHAVEGLIGLGPGLTPSGDDVLAGAALALHALRQSDIAARLAAAAEERRGATHAIAWAHLAAALQGHAGVAFHAVLSAILASDQARLSPLLDQLGAIGHSSGFDMLAGATILLRAASRTL